MNGTAEEQLAILQNAEVHGKFLVFLTPTTSFVLVLFTLYFMKLIFKLQYSREHWHTALARLECQKLENIEQPKW